METLFFKIINMSITASYVITAVILIRILLKKAPKKYSYFLWSVVLFRLICPISFSSVFSIFSTTPFDMTVAQQKGNAVLNYIPSDIGYMTTPSVTVGIPTMNSFISDRLPEAAPYSSVNPLQIWTLLFTILWYLGIAALVIYSSIHYVGLKRSMATAVQLKGNIFESDKIRSPFILGLLRPRIYIPFGLHERELNYILQHELYHLKRKDHLIKAISFYVLILHWFNPLVWLAFLLMTKDMEMSCDEKVLTETGEGIIHEYSTSLLSFAVNRRFPAANLLAFGESGIRERIINVLRFQKPKRWVIVLAAVFCFISVAACAANPAKKSESRKIDTTIYGNYVFEKQIYMNPLSSTFLASDDYKEYYTLTKNSLIVTSETGNQQISEVDYEPADLDEQSFKDSFMIDIIGVPDLSSYKEMSQYTLTDKNELTIYRIYLLDDDIWLAQIHCDTANIKRKEYIWSIYKIKRLEDEIPLKITISGSSESVADFLALQNEFNSGYDMDTCYNITPDYIKENSDYKIFKYNTSSATYLLYENEIYPMGQYFGGHGVISMALGDINGDQKSELYFTYSWGSGLHRSHAAYFDPVKKQVTEFDYVHLNEDMIITDNDTGGLSLYTAKISDFIDFANFKIERVNFISDIIYTNNEVTLTSPVTF